MEKLLKVIQDTYDISQIEILEQNDPMFQALKDLYLHLSDKQIFIPLVLSNSLICYQLSSKWEDYWQEFSLEAGKVSFKDTSDIHEFFLDFLPRSTGNKRLFATKIKRLLKAESFLPQIFSKQMMYYRDMSLLRDDLSTSMKQPKNAKTIVFAIKIFGYAARIHFGEFITFPTEIPIPIDSRLKRIYRELNPDPNKTIESFYAQISDQLGLAPLHLDVILWLDSDLLIKQAHEI